MRTQLSYTNWFNTHFKRHYTTLLWRTLSIPSLACLHSSSPIPLRPPVSGTLDALAHLLSITFFWWHIVQHLHHLADKQGEFFPNMGLMGDTPGWAHVAFVLLWSLERAPKEAHAAPLRSPVTAAIGVEAPKTGVNIKHLACPFQDRQFQNPDRLIDSFRTQTDLQTVSEIFTCDRQFWTKQMQKIMMAW